MTDFSRCPKCTSLYDLRTIDLSPSGGWVQCGECDHKFKAATYEVDEREISFHHAEESTSDTVEIQEADALEQLSQRESEFSEKSITMEVSSTANSGTHAESDFAEFVEELLEPEMFVEGVHVKASPENEEVETNDDSNSTTRRYTESMSEFSEERIDIKPNDEEEPRPNFFDEVAEANLKGEAAGNKFSLSKILLAVAALAGVLFTAFLLAFQVHSRGNFKWIPSQQYEKLVSIFPQLSRFEKNQFDLAQLHLASARMEVFEDGSEGRRIVLQLVNKSRYNQAFPDFQVEFTNAKGEAIARRLILPNMYLEQGHLGVLESKEAKTLYFDIAALPKNAAGYELKIVNQNN